MRCIFIVCALALVLNSAHAQTKRLTFTSGNGVFRFHYASMLVHCKRYSSQAEWWLPGDSCNSYSPVCIDNTFPVPGGSTTLTCFAYPKHKFEDTNFQAAAFVVAESSTNRRECLTVWDPAVKKRILNVNGTPFITFSILEASTGNILKIDAYRNFHDEKCYSLTLNLAWSNPGGWEPGTIKLFTDKDRSEVYKPLKQALESFKFLK